MPASATVYWTYVSHIAVPGRAGGGSFKGKKAYRKTLPRECAQGL